MRKKTSLQDIYRIYQVVVRVPKLINILDELCSTTVDNVLVTPMKDTLSVSICSIGKCYPQIFFVLIFYHGVRWENRRPCNTI